MAKISAVGSKFYYGGYDLSGDVTALSTIAMNANQQDVTVIESTAMERILLRRDGEIAVNAVFNPATGRSHPVLRSLPSTEQGAMWAQAATSGAIAAMLMAKQANFNEQFGSDGALLLSAQALAAVGAGVEWGQIVTAGKRQDTSATASGTGIDLGIPDGETAISLSGASAANPTVVTTATPHGYTSGDSVIIAGTDKSALNDELTITVTGASTFTVPVDLSGGAATGGTVTRTSTRTGFAAQRQTFSFTGTSSTVTLQHAPKNDAASFADVTGGAFTAATAVGSERITGAATALLQRYVRVKTTGTFSEHTFAIGVARL